MESIKTEVVEDKQKRDKRGRRIVAAERWAEVLAEYDASGLTQSAFARRAGLNFHTFVAQLGRRRRGQVGSPAVHFREVCLAPPVKTAALLEVLLPGGVIVRGSMAAMVAELVRALRA